MTDPRHNIRDVFPPTGPEISAKSWLTEAPLRMLMNNLHPDVAENPHELVVYGGIGRAARTWDGNNANGRCSTGAAYIRPVVLLRAKIRLNAVFLQVFCRCSHPRAAEADH